MSNPAGPNAGTAAADAFQSLTPQQLGAILQQKFAGPTPTNSQQDANNAVVDIQQGGVALGSAVAAGVAVEGWVAGAYAASAAISSTGYGIIIGAIIAAVAYIGSMFVGQGGDLGTGQRVFINKSGFVFDGTGNLITLIQKPQTGMAAIPGLSRNGHAIFIDSQGNILKGQAGPGYDILGNLNSRTDTPTELNGVIMPPNLKPFLTREEIARGAANVAIAAAHNQYVGGLLQYHTMAFSHPQQPGESTDAWVARLGYKSSKPAYVTDHQSSIDTTVNNPAPSPQNPVVPVPGSGGPPVGSGLPTVPGVTTPGGIASSTPVTGGAGMGLPTTITIPDPRTWDPSRTTPTPTTVPAAGAGSSPVTPPTSTPAPTAPVPAAPTGAGEVGGSGSAPGLPNIDLASLPPNIGLDAKGNGGADVPIPTPVAPGPTVSATPTMPHGGINPNPTPITPPAGTIPPQTVAPDPAKGGIGLLPGEGPGTGLIPDAGPPVQPHGGINPNPTPVDPTPVVTPPTPHGGVNPAAVGATIQNAVAGATPDQIGQAVAALPPNIGLATKGGTAPVADPLYNYNVATTQPVVMNMAAA
jgi:hypothetical protein